jgi:hypothetical protein
MVNHGKKDGVRVLVPTAEIEAIVVLEKNKDALALGFKELK